MKTLWVNKMGIRKLYNSLIPTTYVTRTEHLNSNSSVPDWSSWIRVRLGS